LPFYRDLNPQKNDIDKRAVERLLLLRDQLKEIPERTQKNTLLLATWNIRDFARAMLTPPFFSAYFHHPILPFPQIIP